MARKKPEKPVPATEAPSKAVRLDLDAESHRKLRLEAAKLEKPMAAVVRDLVEEFLRRKEAER